ncbi:hypothetical protein HPB49_024457 [Dermacentor silvarum]|uniref:Uncharacterized protein n=2 Tax=Dermacentor silvarum TaxID=543639 RepID=A0ACB8D0Z1_DERSI|nr:hypothetical protein HPB49_024457 [Dermacentor silvarum]
MEDREFLPSYWGHRLRGQELIDHFCRETARLSEETRSRVAAQKDIRFGEHPRECLDLYHGGRPAGECRSTLLFWHGGYWIEGDRQSHAFVADPFVEVGVAVAVAGYPLAPGATLDQIVESATRCARHVLALRSGPLVLAGHSAGAHLAAMVATRLHGEPRLRALLLLSPVLDVVALLGSSVARDAAIGTDQAVRSSPLHLVDKLPTHLHVVVTYAEHDPPWFGRTARAYCEALGRRRISCELLEYADEDHFSFLLGALRDGEHRVTTRLVGASLAATAPSPTPRVAEATSVMEDREFLPSYWGLRLRGQELIDHFCRETARLSEETRSRVAAQKDIRFGEHPRECLDLYHGGRSAGECRSTLLFWHGGYWIEGDRQSHAFVADPFVEVGVAVAVAGYPLAPGATLDQIVESATRCARHVLALRSGPLVLAGHSAGAHLAAMVATRLHGEPRLRALLLLSPVLDVVALLGSSVARDAAIGTDQAVRNSPLQLVDKLSTHLHVVVTYAEHDPPWFGRTARAYCEALGRRRISCELLVYADEDHYSFLLGALRDSEHRVTARLVGASLAATAPSLTPR